MSESVGYATLQIIPSIRGLDSKIKAGLKEQAGSSGDESGSLWGKRFSDSAKRSLDNGGIADKLKSIAKVAAIGGAVLFGIGATIAGFGIHASAQLETTKTSFTALLGSAQAAQTQLVALQKYAAATPFSQQDVFGYAQQFYTLAGSVGLSKDQLIPFLDAVGNLGAVTGASTANIHNAVMAIGQIGSSGKVTLDNLNQISEAFPGFNGAAAIANATGQTTAQVMKQISNGTLSAATGVNALLIGMQKFPGAAGAMVKQSETLNGLWSTFTDTIKISLTQAFGPLIPVVKKTLNTLTPIIKGTLDKLAPILSQFAKQLAPILGPIIQSLGQILGVFFQALGPILQALTPLIKPLTDLFVQLVRSLSPLLTFLAQIAATLGPPVVKIFNALLVALHPVIGAFINALKPVLPVIADALLRVFNALKPLLATLSGAFVKVINALAPQLPGLAKSFGDLAVSLAKILTALSPLIGPLTTLLTKLLTGPVIKTLEGIASALTGVANAVSGLLGGLANIPSSFSNTFAFASNETYSFTQQTESDLALMQDWANKNPFTPQINTQPFFAALNNVNSAIGKAVGAIGKAAGQKAASGFTIPKNSGTGTKTGGAGSSKPTFDTSTLSAFAKSLSGTADQIASAFASMLKSGEASGKFSKAFAKALSVEETALQKLAKQRDSIANKLKAATDKLTAAKQLYSDEKSSTSSAVTGTFDVSNVQSVYNDRTVNATDILASLNTAVANAGKFSAAFKALAKRGLPQGLLQQLAAAGPQALPQALALLAAAPTTFSQIKSDYSQLGKIGSDLGTFTANTFYGAGVQTAQGLVDGLKSQENVIAKAIEHLANVMITQVKKTLGIHSPSKVGIELGANYANAHRLGVEAETPGLHKSIGNMFNTPTPKAQLTKWSADSNTRNVPSVYAPISVTGVSDPEAAAVATARHLRRRVV